MRKNYNCREEKFLSDEFTNILCEPTIARPKKESIGKYVNLLNDTGFKHVFGREANKDIIIAFLNEIIPDRHILDIEHLRNEQIPMRIESKKIQIVSDICSKHIEFHSSGTGRRRECSIHFPSERIEYMQRAE